MVIIVTGAVGIGKTTVCRRIIDIARNQGYTYGGILTYKAADQSIIIEDTQSGEKETLASTKAIYPGPNTQRYFFNPEGIKFGDQAIERGFASALLLIDEIGHLELSGEGFARVPETIRANKTKKCILVIRKGLLSAFLPRLPSKPLVFEITLSNRNQLPQEITSILLRELH